MLDDILSLRMDDLAHTLNRVRLPKHPRTAFDDQNDEFNDDDGIVQLENLALPAGFWSYVEKKVQMRAGNLFHEVGDLQSDLRAIEAMEQSEERDVGLREIWNAFDVLRDNANDVFAEFLELVAGLAFRERSLDWWVFRAADSIVTDCADLARQRWDPVTVPGLKHAVVRTLEQVVRLRFPDWTIWALPITAYEFWRVYLPSGDEQPERAVRLIIDRCKAFDALNETMLDLMADAFATFTLGPSYACAALMLKVSVEEANRVHVILRSLELAGGAQERRRGTYDGPIVAPIRTWWADSLRTLSVAAEQVAELDEFAEFSFTAFDRYFPGALYPRTRWSDYVEPTSAALAQGRETPHKDLLRQRDLLNAVWHARLSGDGINDDIAVNGQEVFKQLLARQQRGGEAVLPTAPAEA